MTAMLFQHKLEVSQIFVITADFFMALAVQCFNQKIRLSYDILCTQICTESFTYIVYGNIPSRLIIADLKYLTLLQQSQKIQ